MKRLKILEGKVWGKLDSRLRRSSRSPCRFRSSVYFTYHVCIVCIHCIGKHIWLPAGGVDGKWGEDSAWSTSLDLILLHSQVSGRRASSFLILPKQSLRTAYLTLMSAWTVHTRPHRDFQRILSTGVIYKARALSLCAYKRPLPISVCSSIYTTTPLFHMLTLSFSYFTLWPLFNTLLADDTLLHIFPFYNDRITFTPRYYSSSCCPTAPFL